MMLTGKIVSKLMSLANQYRIRKYEADIQGSGYTLGSRCIMAYPQNISIGSGTFIYGGYILASQGAKISIGANCLISYEVHLRTDTHNYKDADRPIRMQGSREADINIEDDVWIGFGAQIMPGVTVRKGSVIGAGAVVTHSTEEYGVYAGVPAKKISQRVSMS